MKLHYVKVNPVENMTIFVLDQIPRKEHINISNKLMDYSNIHAEQVGFVEASTNDSSSIRLQMMGGEFCGNATRSLAAFMVHSDYPQIVKSGDNFIVPLEVSGIKDIINCKVEKLQGTNAYLSEIEMPLALSIKEIEVPYNDCIVKTIRVDLPGISHFIVDKDKLDDKTLFYEIVKKTMNDEDYEAFGIMYYDYDNKFMEPLVYVRATDSLFWERSCASGTCAFGCAQAFISKKPVDEFVTQPGGKLEVTVAFEDGNINSLHLNGEVEIISEGIVYI